jgi:hypothetical protein
MTGSLLLDEVTEWSSYCIALVIQYCGEENATPKARRGNTYGNFEGMIDIIYWDE